MEPCLWFSKGQANGSSEKHNVYRGFLGEPVVSLGEDMHSKQKVFSESRGKKSEKVTVMIVKPAALTANTKGMYQKGIPLTCLHVSWRLAGWENTDEVSLLKPEHPGLQGKNL